MAITKRFTIPRFWPLEVKAKKYAISPTPGPHTKSHCMPLGVIIRDVLKHSRTLKETRQILNTGTIKINGAVRKSYAFPVGLMDVVEMDGEFYRVVPSKAGLKLVPVKDADTRLSKVRNKSHIHKKRIQLSLHDGTNILVDKEDYKTSDVIVLDTKTKKIKEVIKFEKGAMALVTDGHNRGVQGNIENIDRKLRTVSLKNDTGSFLVPLRYVFVIGRDKPVVNVGE